MSKGSKDVKHDWTKEELLGEARVRSMAQNFESHGFMVVAPLSFNHEGVDIEVWRKDEPDVLLTVIEVTNYSKPVTKVNPRKFKRYLDNLNSYDWRKPEVAKWLVVSYRENLYDCQVRRLDEYGIKLRIYGHTDTIPQKDGEND